METILLDTNVVHKNKVAISFYAAKKQFCEDLITERKQIKPRESD